MRSTKLLTLAAGAGLATAFIAASSAQANTAAPTHAPKTPAVSSTSPVVGTDAPGDGQTGQSGTDQNGEVKTGQSGTDQNGEVKTGQSGTDQNGEVKTGQGGTDQNGEVKTGQTGTDQEK